MPPETHGLHSSPAWSRQDSDAALGEPAALDSAHPAEQPGRYLRGAPVGAGAMGVVVVAWDPLLKRHIAVKKASSPLGSSAERLRREASIMARLEHPNIVPVFDSGCDADGLPWLAMRLVHGRTLADVLAAGAPVEALLRNLLAVCQGMAHAHASGVLHRDLKPDNVLVAEQGGVQIVDWGLACLLGDRDAPSADGAMQDGAQTQEGTVLGTPLYMSPEAAAGLAHDARSDVFCLGTMLFHACCGRPLRTAQGAAQALQLARHHQIPPLPEGLDPALGAIVRCCLAADRTQRYADAGALTQDLANYLDGRRVQAHAYSTLDLAGRLVRAWKWPILGTIAVLLVLSIGAAVSAQRILRERTRAVEAEAASASALVAARQSRADLMVRQAQNDAQAFNWASAEGLAAAALVDASPGADSARQARGILMAARAGRQAEHLSSLELPKCRFRAIDESGHLVLCLTSSDASLWTTEPLQRRWQLDVVADYGVIVASQELAVLRTPTRLLLIGLQDGHARGSTPGASAPEPIVAGPHGLIMQTIGETVALTSPGGGRQLLAACGSRVPIAAVGVHGDGLVAACADATLVACDLAGACTDVAATGVQARDITAVTASATGQRAWLATARGEALTCDLAAHTCDPPRQVAHGVIRQLEPRGERLLVRGDRGDVYLLASQTLLPYLQLSAGSVTDAHFDGSALVTASSHLRRWQLPQHLQVVRLETPPGASLSALAVADGAMAVGLATGAVQLRDLGDGRVRWQELLAPGVVKVVAIVPPRPSVLASTPASPGVFEVAPGVSRLVSTPNVRRMALLPGPAGPIAVGATYAEGLRAWQVADGRGIADVGAASEDWLDLASTTDGQAAVGVENASHGVWQLRIVAGQAGPQLQRRLLHTDATTRHTAAAAADTGFLTANDTDLSWFRRAGDAQPQVWSVPSRVCDLAVAPQGPWLLAGLVDGSVVVWLPGRAAPLARLRLHTERVAVLALTDGATSLWTGSWDGSVRRIDLRPLVQEPQAALEDANRYWGAVPGLVGGHAE